MKSYKNHKMLLSEVSKARSGHDGKSGLLEEEVLRINVQNKLELWANFKIIAYAVRHYMLSKAIPEIHVREPIGCEHADGSIHGWVLEVLGDDHVFLAAVTVGDGVYYYAMPVGGPTLIDLYENAIGDELKPKTSDRAAHLLYKSGRYKDFVDMEASYFEKYLPPRGSFDGVRGYFHHDFYFDHVQHTDVNDWNLDRLANRLALASLYYPEIAFWLQPLGRPRVSGSAREASLRERLRFLASVKPLVQNKVLYPVYISMNSKEMMPLWLDSMTYYNYEYEDTHLDLAKKVYGDTFGVSVCEHMEVFTQSDVSACLCGAHDICTDRLFFLFTQFLAQQGDIPSVARIDPIFSGMLLDSIILPSLEGCPIADVIAIRSSGEHLAAFRRDMSAVLNNLVDLTLSEDFSRQSPNLSRMAKDLFRTRLDSLEKDIGRSSVKEHIKQAGWSFSLGALMGFALTGEPISSMASGALAELLSLSLRRLKSKKSLAGTEALGRLYSALIDLDKKPET